MSYCITASLANVKAEFDRLVYTVGVKKFGKYGLLVSGILFLILLASLWGYAQTPKETTQQMIDRIVKDDRAAKQASSPQPTYISKPAPPRPISCTSTNLLGTVYTWCY